MIVKSIAVLVALAATPVHAAEVAIKDFAFVPATLEVAVGDTVTWVNRDESPHQVVSETKLFRSGGLDTGERFSFTVSAPGRYSYFCGMHPQMVGTLVAR